MALFKILRGESSSFTTDLQSINVYPEFHDGYCYFTADTGLFYIDYDDGSETIYNQFSGADVGYQLTEGKAYYLFNGNVYSLYEGNYNLLTEYGDPSAMPYFYYKTDGKRRIPLNAKQAEEFLGYSIENVLNDSEVEIPTSSAVFQASKKDWNQNDETAPDYIKNRTHYTDLKLSTVKVDNYTIVTDENGQGGGIDYDYFDPDDPWSVMFNTDIQALIIDGNTYYGDVFFTGEGIYNDGHAVIFYDENNNIVGRIDATVVTSWYFGALTFSQFKPNSEITLSLYNVEENVYPLDHKYITSITETNKGLEQKFWRGTKEEYDAVEEKDDSVLYLVTDQFEAIESTYMDQATYDPQEKKTDIFQYAENTHKTPKSGLILIDSINGKNYVISTENGNLISRPYITSLRVKTFPSKMTYSLNETFDPTGMVVEAVYEDGAVEEIDFYSYNTIVTDFNFSIYYNQAGNVIETILELTER